MCAKSVRRDTVGDNVKGSAVWMPVNDSLINPQLAV